jgi:hypothetical protein
MKLVDSSHFGLEYGRFCGETSKTSGGALRSGAGGACEAPPHKDGNRLADQFQAGLEEKRIKLSDSWSLLPSSLKLNR